MLRSCGALVLLIILGAYALFGLRGSPPVPVEWGAVVLAHMVNFAYRWHKGHLSPEWLLDRLVLKWKREEVC